MLAGAVASVGTMMYSTLLLLPMLGVLSFFLTFRFGRALAASAVMVAVFVVSLSPLLLYNISQFGEARLTTRPFWFNVARGLGHTPNPWGFLPDDGVVFGVVAKAHPEYISYGTGNEYNSDVERYLKEEIVKEIKEKPLWYIGGALERFSMAVLPLHWAITQGEFQEDAEGKTIMKPRGEVELWGALLASIWIITAFAGIWIAREKWRLATPLLLVLLSFLGLHTLTVVHPYYLNVLSFVYAVWSAYAVYRMYLWARNKFLKKKNNL